MKIRIKSNPITPHGSFSVGDELDDTKYPESFLLHLVNDCNAADFIDYETKVDTEYKIKKKPQSSQSSQQGKASPKPTAKPRKNKRKS